MKVLVWGLGDQYSVLEPMLQLRGVDLVVGIDDTGKNPVSPPFEVITVTELSTALNVAKPLQVSHFIVSVANPYGFTRVNLSQFLTSHFEPLSLVHPSSWISQTARIGVGTQLMPHAVVHERAHVGDWVIINTRALVEHHCEIDDGVEVGPGATICGRVAVGKHSWIGAGATVLPRVKIGENAIIGAGTVVTRDVEPGWVVVGNPGHRVEMSALEWDRRRGEEELRLGSQLGK